jgi:hypothetical protein
MYAQTESHYQVSSSFHTHTLIPCNPHENYTAYTYKRWELFLAYYIAMNRSLLPNPFYYLNHCRKWSLLVNISSICFKMFSFFFIVCIRIEYNNKNLLWGGGRENKALLYSIFTIWPQQQVRCSTSLSNHWQRLRDIV